MIKTVQWMTRSCHQLYQSSFSEAHGISQDLHKYNRIH